MRSSSFEKPWRLVVRRHDLGGTDYEHIANITTEHAILISREGGVSFLMGTPDWANFYKEQEIEQAKIDLRVATDKLAALEGGE